MGNQTSFTSNSSSSKFVNYQQIKTNEIGTICRKKQTDQTFILKQYNFPNKSIYQSQYNKYFQMKNDTQKDQGSNMLAVKQVSKEQINHFCSNIYKIYVLYEYPNVTLRDQILARSKDNKYFQEAELWSIFQTCITALNELKYTAPFSPKFIFISPDGVIKTLNSDLIDENYRHFLNQQYYYAPQKLANFMNQNSSQMSHKKQSIFSIAMTILQASLLVDNYDCYDFTTGQVSQQKIKERLQQILQVYSQNFVTLLSGMLQKDPSKRLTLLQIQKYLNKFWQQSQLQQNGYLNCIDEQNYETNEQMQKKCSQLFNQKSLKKTNLPESTSQQNQYDSQPSIPNLLSKQNSRINYNQIYMTGKTNDLDEGLKFQKYQKNCNKFNEQPISYNMPKQEKKNFNINLQNQDGQLFTDPKLLEMIKKDLQQINQIRMSTSRHVQIQKQQKNLIKKQCPPIATCINSSHQQFLKLQENPRSFYSNQKIHIDDYEEVQSLMASAHTSSDKKFTYRYQQSQVKNNKQRQISQSIALSKLVFPESFNNSKINKALKQKDQNLPQPKYDMTKKQNYQNCDLIYKEEIYQDGVKYQGMTKNGFKQGYGRLIYNDGAYYQGYFMNDMISGNGTLFYKQNYPAYKGEWVNQQFQGYGQLFNQEPQIISEPFNYMNFNQIQNFWIKYQGQFDQDNKCGKGKLYLTNGECIEGNFQNDTVNGAAKFTDLQGNHICGIWQNNILRQIIDQN